MWLISTVQPGQRKRCDRGAYLRSFSVYVWCQYCILEASTPFQPEKSFLLLLIWVLHLLSILVSHLSSKHFSCYLSSLAFNWEMRFLMTKGFPEALALLKIASNFHASWLLFSIQFPWHLASISGFFFSLDSGYWYMRGAFPLTLPTSCLGSWRLLWVLPLQKVQGQWANSVS